MNYDFLVDFPGLGIEDLPVRRVAFWVFTLPVYWYGLLIAAAIILCMLLAMRHAAAYKLTSDDVMDTLIAIIPLMIIFARIYYVIGDWEKYAADWKLIFDTRNGGLGFYGGVIGGALAVLLITRLKKIPLARLLDFFAVYVPLGQAIGRWGNFFNQEAFGTPTALPWGMKSNQTEYYLKSIGGYDPSLPVHPTFLYEFIANLIIFAILLRIRKKSKTPYAVTLWYLLLYGFVRFFVEGIRTDSLLIPGTEIRTSQVLSALMVIVSIILLIVLNQRRQKQELAAALAEDSAFIPTAAEQGSADSAFVEITDEDQKASAPGQIIGSGEPQDEDEASGPETKT
ncbi:MAG TPA: prolipoprotein diacylglyceryl transferase [Clostridiales bacterium]|nr:prolipoprotein diacylglyceryl transferase [Clostridiales bacterium]